MSKSSFLWLLTIVFGLSTQSLADEVYRTVTKSGQVIFSDTPPANANQIEKIELPPGPSPGSVRSTESRNRAIRKHLQQMQNKRERKTQHQDNEVMQAEKALAAAEAQLEKAKKIEDTDRQSLAGGKSRLHPNYFERVKAAEEAVEKAKKNLERVRRGY